MGQKKRERTDRAKLCAAEKKLAWTSLEIMKRYLKAQADKKEGDEHTEDAKKD